GFRDGLLIEFTVQRVGHRSLLPPSLYRLFLHPSTTSSGGRTSFDSYTPSLGRITRTPMAYAHDQPVVPPPDGRIPPCGPKSARRGGFRATRACSVSRARRSRRRRAA